ncbi:MAG: ankyrin repeat domain-containing protein [Candidatus Hydrogenedentes bacterium]|nr:ankyrin repeat domain-containing protein [Candidatus Hydrogenedentota bacterium]
MHRLNNGTMTLLRLGVLCSAAMAILALVPACSGGADYGEEEVKAEYVGDPMADVEEAVKAGDTAKVGELLKQDPTLLDWRDEQGRTLLHLAVICNQTKIVDLLIEEGLDPNILDDNDETPLSALDSSGFRAPEARKAIMAHGGQT